MAGQTDTIIDITRQLRWEVSKERIEREEEQFERGAAVQSPKFEIKINNQVSNWIIGIESRVRHLSGHNTGENMILFNVSMMTGDVSLDVEIERIGVETENGYIAGTPKTDFLYKKTISQIEHFNGRSPVLERVCAADGGSIEDFFKMSNRNKVTLVATLRFYIDRNIQKNEREKNFFTHLRAISDLETLADFTIFCGDREFKCHRIILASRSTVFKTMLLNDRFVENRENSVTIENAKPDTVEAMLEFISKGVIPGNIEEKAIDLINLADRYDLQDLIKICESSLVDNLTGESAIETLIAIDLHVPNSQHRQKILDFIKSKASEVVKSSHWKDFLVKYPNLVAEIFLWAAIPPGEANDK